MTYPPDLDLHYAPCWAHCNSGSDLTTWAPLAAKSVWEATEQPHSRLDVERMTVMLEHLAGFAFRTGAVGVFLLCPEPAGGPTAVLTLRAVSLDDGSGRDDLVADLMHPAGNQLLPPDSRELPTPAGTVLRLHQRAVDDETRAISDWLSYVWEFPTSAWVLSTSFPDLRVLETWASTMDDLVGGFHLLPPDAA